MTDPKRASETAIADRAILPARTEVEKDAERYRWIRDVAGGAAENAEFWAAIRLDNKNIGFIPEEACDMTLDEAIDFLRKHHG